MLCSPLGSQLKLELGFWSLVSASRLQGAFGCEMVTDGCTLSPPQCSRSILLHSCDFCISFRALAIRYECSPHTWLPEETAPSILMPSGICITNVQLRFNS